MVFGYLASWIVSQTQMTTSDFSYASARFDDGTYHNVDIKHLYVRENRGYVVVTPDNRAYTSKNNDVRLHR